MRKPNAQNSIPLRVVEIRAFLFKLKLIIIRLCHNSQVQNRNMQSQRLPVKENQMNM